MKLALSRILTLLPPGRLPSTSLLCPVLSEGSVSWLTPSTCPAQALSL